MSTRPAAGLGPPDSDDDCHGTARIVKAMSMRASRMSSAGQAIAHRQSIHWVMTALSGGPTIDGSSQTSENSPNTRGRSRSS